MTYVMSHLSDHASGFYAETPEKCIRSSVSAVIDVCLLMFSDR